jgi:hypothetical protein
MAMLAGGLEGTRDVKADQRVDQFVRLRDAGRCGGLYQKVVITR